MLLLLSCCGFYVYLCLEVYAYPFMISLLREVIKLAVKLQTKISHPRNFASGAHRCAQFEVIKIRTKIYSILETVSKYAPILSVGFPCSSIIYNLASNSLSFPSAVFKCTSVFPF